VAKVHPNLKADFVPVRKDLANPLFNMGNRGDEHLRHNVRCTYSIAPLIAI
jgi:hypothetical protein